MTRVGITVEPAAEPLLQRAVDELAEFLPRVWDVQIARDEGADIRIALRVGDAGAEPRDGSFRLRTSGHEVEIVGVDAAGALYGAYELLERLGVRFYLTGPSLPRRRPAAMPELDIMRSPEVALRGVMPYTDFLTGPSTWDREDYEAEIDNAARLRLNLFSMHFYTFEPVGRFVYKGVERTEAYWDTSRTTRWRKRPGRISDFVAGREHFAQYEEWDAFGARSALTATSPRERFDLAEADIRAAFRRAKERGMTTTIGFEVTDPPLEFRSLIPPESRFGDDGFGVCISSPDARELLTAWIRGVLDAVPDVDVISLWQTETGPARWTAGCPCDECVRFRAEHPLPEYTLANVLGDVSGSGYYVGHITESAQNLLQWVLLGVDIVREVAPEKKIALAGWFIEHMFPDAQCYVPEDVILSSMTEIDPWEAPPFMEYYKGVDRRTWMINWWEIDFRMWLPQPKASAYPPLLEKVDEYDVEAVIWQHWRSRTVDDNARYTALAMWDRTLDPGDYYRDAVGVEWGADAAGPFAEGMLAFEEFERWLVHDVGFQIFAQDWFPPVISIALEYLAVHGPVAEKILVELRAKLERIPEIRSRLERVLELLTAARDRAEVQRDGDRPGFWLHRVELYMLYIDALEGVARATLAYADATSVQYPAVERAPQLAEAYWLLRAAPVKGMIEKLAERIECKGDLGTLVNLNNELWARYKRALDVITEWFDEVGPGEMWSIRIRDDGSFRPTITGPDAVSPIGQWAHPSSEH